MARLDALLASKLRQRDAAKARRSTTKPRSSARAIAERDLSRLTTECLRLETKLSKIKGQTNDRHQPG